jgi:membrane-associated protease RseP (regulator of RpoE activity)
MLAQAEPGGPFSTAWSIFLLVVGFSLVIFVHELGHFLAAKWAKVRVEKFCIGFGRELFGFTRGATRYAFNVLPLGGYVKMLGQEDFVVDKSGELKVKADPDSFTSKSISQRMVIVSAGVIMNLLFAGVAFAVVQMVGRYRIPAVVGEVVENSPAGRAMLQPGDRILEMNGRHIRSWEDVAAIVTLSNPDEALVLRIERDGKELLPSPQVLPEYKKDQQLRQIGILSAMSVCVAEPSLSPVEAPAPNELHEYDILYGLIGDGQVRPQTSIAPFFRAILGARGAPVDVAVKRPLHPEAITDKRAMDWRNADLQTEDATVQVRAVWLPSPYEKVDDVSGSLLGLVPRMTAVDVVPKKSFAKAGVLRGDVVAKIGEQANPTFAELQRLIQENPDGELAIEVRRSRAANHGLAARTVEFCVRHREALIVAALADAAQPQALAAELLKGSNLPAEEQQKLLAKLQEAGDGPGRRKWLDDVDVHRLSPLTPKQPFTLFAKEPPPVDARLLCVDEDHVVVADVVEKYGDRVTPAKAAGIPRGAVITAVDGRPVGRWCELSETFRAKAGQAVELTYRAADEVLKAKMTVPSCISAALDIPPGGRIVKIGGKTSLAIETEKGKVQEIALPDWRVIEKLLRASVGQTVSVEYEDAAGRKQTAEYAVTEENADPWLGRANYRLPFTGYPLQEVHRESNPLVAVGVGFQQAYDATAQTIQVIRHMVFTHQVGVSKVSGPVGIIRLGSHMADLGVIDLLFFLAVISANLAVINFLPMPIVDGGLFLFLILEKIRGEPVSIKAQIATQLIGIALIISLFVLITYQDVRNWILGT